MHPASPPAPPADDAPPVARGAAVSETHVATLFFVGDRAYKLKKPVDLGFLDFRTREARERACRREVELNRRFSPDVYLGVAEVHAPSGELCDHLVVMRRMPAERRLSSLIRAGAPVSAALREVARRLATWHAAAPRGPDIAAEGTKDALLGRWASGFDQVRPFHGHALDSAETAETERLALRFLAGREALFDRRIREGRVLDGHGDLLADDIFCLDDGPRILDCLEFDDRLRRLDGLDDAAFLAMDLERLAATGLAEAFLGWYTQYAGDPAPPSLCHHYVAYRAFVRAKVACMRWAQGDEHAAAEAGALGEIALRHLRAGAVTLTLVGGLPGTGKSSLAGALADRLGRTLLSSDRIRKELAGLAPDHPAAAEYGSGIYTEAWTRRVYAELLDRAKHLLSLGESVIIDASWTAEEHRRGAARVASGTDADLIALSCQAPTDVTERRLRTRARGVSDADPAVAAAMAVHAAPWPEAAGIDTGDLLERAVDQALKVILPHGAGHLWHRRPRLSPG